MKRLHLVHNGTMIGHLDQDSGGTMRLTAPPIDGIPRLSLAFAPSAMPIKPRQALAYVEGLLPEGDKVREATAREAGVSPRSPFGLLSVIGRDCPGAIQFLSDDHLDAAEDGTLSPVSEQQIAQRLRTLRTSPSAAWAKPHEHWSLGGAQAKFALRREDDAWHEARGAQATTHIIKPGIISFASQALVEHVSLRAFEHLGLNVARTRFERFDDEPAIVIERFDRIPDDNGVLLRVHQEDLCQATSTLPAHKYDVTELDVVTTLRNAGAPEEDVLHFVQAVLANWVLGAPDAHAKNHSVFLGPDNLVRLAPLYDVATGLGYGDLPELAMGIGGEKAFRRVTGRHVLKFAGTVGVDGDTALVAAATMASLMPAALDLAVQEVAGVADGADLNHLERVQSALADHCRHVLTALEDS